MAPQKVNPQSKLIRYITAPFRALSKLKDIYIQNMINCAGHASYASAAAHGGSAPYGLPKSFSVNSVLSSNDDYSELIRAASVRSLGREIQVGIGHPKQRSCAAGPTVKRCRTVAIRRIDEDKASDFADDLWLFSRSRSYAAVTKRRNFY